jgi:hypothetical protein
MREVGAHVGDGGTSSIEVKKRKKTKRIKKERSRKSKLFQL